MTSNRFKYFAALFMATLFSFLVITYVFWSNGRSLIWSIDGFHLYYVYFLAEGEWIREALFGLITTGTFQLPMYSYDLGYGADFLLSGAGNMNDPLNLVSVICPQRYAEIVFIALIFVRFFLAAVAFSLYCLSHKKSYGATFIGSISYVLTGYIILWAVLRHPNFLNVAIVFPLILMGADKIFKQKSPVVFILALAASFFFSVYFSYMVCIALLGYCLIRYFVCRETKGIKDFCFLVLRFIGYICVAALLAGLVLIPEVQILLSMDRVSVERPIELLNSIGGYWGEIGSLSGSIVSTRGAYIGAFSLICIFILLVAKKHFDLKERRALVVALSICLVGFITPYFGHILNGFGYSTDRWMFVLSFCAAYTVVLCVPIIKDLTCAEWKRVTLCIVPVILLLVLYWLDYLTIQAGAAMLIFVITFVVFFFIAKKGTWKQSVVLLSVVSILGTGILVNIYAGILGISYAKQFFELGELNKKIDSSPAALIASSNYETDNYRFDQAKLHWVRNVNVLYGVKGVNFYSSFYNQDVDIFRQELGISDDHFNYRFVGNDSRAALEYLVGAKYFVASKNDSSRVPYGYDLVDESNKKYNIYSTKYALPLSFACSKIISADDYASMNMLEKQDALTQGCVVEGETTNVSYDSSTSYGGAKIVSYDGVVLQGNTLFVTKAGGKIQIDLKQQSDAENYLCFENFQFEDMTPASLREVAGKGSADQSLRQKWNETKWQPAGKAVVYIDDGNVKQDITLSTTRDVGYGGKVNWAIHLFSQSDVVTIEFERTGKYTFDSLYSASQSSEAIANNIENLALDDIVDTSFEKDKIESKVGASPKNERWIFYSIPYSNGWSATIDGEPAQITKADTTFMAIQVDGNSHEIVLTYETPGIRIGLICMIIGVVALFVILYRYRRLDSK